MQPIRPSSFSVAAPWQQAHAASRARGSGVEQARAARVARRVQQPGQPRPQPVAALRAALRKAKRREERVSGFEALRQASAAEGTRLDHAGGALRASRRQRGELRGHRGAPVVAWRSRGDGVRRRAVLCLVPPLTCFAAARACHVTLVGQQQQRRALQLPRSKRLRAHATAEVRTRPWVIKRNATHVAPFPALRGSPPAAPPPPRPPRSCAGRVPRQRARARS